MADIGQAVGAKMFGSNHGFSAYTWLLKELDVNKDGKYDPAKGDCKRPVRVFGHSWGAYTAVKDFAQRIKNRRQFVDKNIEVLALIDPVKTARGFVGLTPGNFPTVPDNVSFLWNRYQTGNTDIGIPIVNVQPRGMAVPSNAQRNDQLDVNPPPGTSTFSFPGVPEGITITHWSIVAMVKADVIALMKPLVPATQPQ